VRNWHKKSKIYAELKKKHRAHNLPVTCAEF